MDRSLLTPPYSQFFIVFDTFSFRTLTIDDTTVSKPSNNHAHNPQKFRWKFPSVLCVKTCQIYATHTDI